MDVHRSFPADPTAPAVPFRFPEGRHGQGELAYHAGVPLLRVAGTHEEVGEQIAALAVRPAPRLLDYPEGLLRERLRSKALARLLLPVARRLGRRLLRQFPEGLRREMDGMARAGLDPGRVLV